MIRNGPETLLQQRPALTTTRRNRAMAKSDLLSPDLLRQLLDYDPDNGTLTWRDRPREFFKTKASWRSWNVKYAGKPAFTADDGNGYRPGSILNFKCRAHRVAFAMYHNRWPTRHIDHMNQDRTDNRIANLREVTDLENQRNARKSKNNTSGVTGVTWWERDNNWIAQIGVNYKRILLGYFDTIEEAAAARKEAEIKYGFHENHGR